ncbi:FecR domain-containing protein [Candidatus Parcubacteria bacterium]|nr:FecR domain-containing protein [Candidatus Parcubacteria bacterium]
MSSRTIAVIIVILLVAGGIGAYMMFKKPTQVAAAELEVLQGEVEVWPTPQAKNLVASANMSLPATARVKTRPQSRAVLKFKSGSIIRIDENTEIALSDVSDVAGQSRVSFRVESGQAWARVQQLLETESFEATTANTVAQVRGTSFNTRYRAPTTTVFVWQGVVGVAFRDPETKQVSGQLGEVRVGERKSVRLDPSTPAVGIELRDVTPDEVDDPWVLFNRVEDRKLDKAAGPQASEPVLSEIATTTVTATPSATTPPVETQGKLKIQTAPAPPQPAPDQPKQENKTEYVEPAPKPTAIPKALEISYDGSSSIFAGDTIQFIATLVYSDGKRANATDRVQWAVSSVLGTITEDGFFTAKRAGTGQVTASLVADSNILRGSLPLTVKELSASNIPPANQPKPTATPNSLEISRADNSVIYVGDAVQFTAALVYSDGKREGATDRVHWAVVSTLGIVDPPGDDYYQQPSGPLGTITPGGIFTAQRAGAGQVTASLVAGGETLRASQAVTVQNRPTRY